MTEYTDNNRTIDRTIDGRIYFFLRGHSSYCSDPIWRSAVLDCALDLFH